MEIRRKKKKKRLHYKATQDGKLASLSATGDSLLVDGVRVFSVKEGLIRNGANFGNRPTSSQSNNGRN
jgi:hypothetical protein